MVVIVFIVLIYFLCKYI